MVALPLLTGTAGCGALRGDIRSHGSVQLLIMFFVGGCFVLKKNVVVCLLANCLINTRKLEDKFIQHHIEFRSFFLPMDLSGLHHNRDMPAGFTFYLCVSDATLPSKGTAHRANRGASKAWCLKTIVFLNVLFTTEKTIKHPSRWRKMTSTFLPPQSFGKTSWFPQPHGRLMKVNS